MTLTVVYFNLFVCCPERDLVKKCTRSLPGSVIRNIVRQEAKSGKRRITRQEEKQKDISLPSLKLFIGFMTCKDNTKNKVVAAMSSEGIKTG